MKKTSSLFGLLLVTFLLLSFYQPDSIVVDTAKQKPWPLLVQKEYDSKIKKFLDDRKQKCLDEILKDAETYVDSIIIHEINIKLLDTLIFPNRPQRPDFPASIILDDSTVIGPIIK